jgi:hypothetical protein
MHPIQDLFLESFSYELQFDMHFYMHSYVGKEIYSCKKWVLHFSSYLSAFLSRLCYLQAFLDHPEFLLSISKYFWSEDLVFTSLTPKQRGSTRLSIPCFVQCHLNSSLIVLVVGKFYVGQTLIPTLVVLQGTTSQHIF